MPDMLYVLEGDDHERRAVVAASEEDAREAVANDFNVQYHLGDYHDEDDDEDDGTPYDGSEFNLVGVYPEDYEVDAEMI